MSSHQDRDLRKERGIALREQLEKLGVSLKFMSMRTRLCESYISRACNPYEPTVAPSPTLLSRLEEVLRWRIRELSGIVESEHAAVSLVDTCNGAMATLDVKTRETMAKGLRSRLFSAPQGASDPAVLPNHVAGALFKLDDACPGTAVYVMVVRSGDRAEELASVAHELGDLGRTYSVRARKLRRSSGGPSNGQVPKSAY